MTDKSFMSGKKIIIIVTAVLVVLVAAVLVVLNIMNKKSDEEKEEETTVHYEDAYSEEENVNTDVAFYIKDNNVFMTVYPLGKSVQLTKNVFDISSYQNSLKEYVCLSEDGKKVFYIDETAVGYYGDVSGTLYYKDVDNINGEAVKIAEKVKSFRVLSDKHSDSVAYIAGPSKTLYFSDLQESTEVAPYVDEYEFSPEHEAFFYSAYTALFYKEKGEAAEKIADNVWKFDVVEEGETCYFYKHEYNPLARTVTVYKKTVGMSVERITTGVLTDDVLSRKIFFETGDAYYIKSVTDKLTMVATDVLCYYDAYSETIISQKPSGVNTASNTAAAVYLSEEKVCLAVYDEVYDITTHIGSYSDDCDFEIATAEDGIYMIKKNNNALGTYDLYRIAIEGGVISETELFDGGISKNNSFPVDAVNNLIYFKNLQGTGLQEAIPYEDQSRYGDLYFNKELIDAAVDVYRVFFNEEHNCLCYFTNWNQAEEKGTLRCYNGEEAVTIADGVSKYQITDDGNVLFVKNNELFIFDDGKTVSLETSIGDVPEFYHSNVNAILLV